jgi:hypothetical protein
MPWEKLVNGEWIPQPSSGRPGAPLGNAAVRAGPLSASAIARELHERHKREGRAIRKVLARAARRRAWRPAVVYAAPTSTRRQREQGHHVVAASGRDGTAERDDGSGSDGGDGGGGGVEPPGPRSGTLFAGGAS